MKKHRPSRWQSRADDKTRSAGLDAATPSEKAAEPAIAAAPPAAASRVGLALIGYRFDANGELIGR